MPMTAIIIVARTLLTIGVFAVAWLSLAPQDSLPEVDIWDKLAHFLAYAVLALLGGFAFWAGRTWVTVGILLMAYGSFLEIAQKYIPGRSGTIEDALADWFGVIVGLAVVRVLRRRFGPPAGLFNALNLK